jgi:hypothetical protein
VQFGLEYGANVATSVASGKGAEWDKNVVNAGMGLAGGAAAGRLLGGMSEGAAKSISTGALGGAMGSVGGDTVNNAYHGEKFDTSQMFAWCRGQRGWRWCRWWTETRSGRTLRAKHTRSCHHPGRAGRKRAAARPVVPF